MASGRFITFEGGEGVGKSSQARRLYERIRERGFEVVQTREPGGSPFAEQVRDLALSATTAPHNALSEALLFYAARADHLDRLIRPALAQGRWVISDRFSDSTRVYQSVVGGLARETFDELETLVVAPTRPDLSLILDLAPEEGLARASNRRVATGNRGIDAYEGRTLEFHRHLRQGFLDLAAAEPDRCAVIDGSGDAGAVSQRVWTVVAKRLFGEG